jgi:hypothetical protein
MAAPQAKLPGSVVKPVVLVQVQPEPTIRPADTSNARFARPSPAAGRVSRSSGGPRKAHVVATVEHTSAAAEKWPTMLPVVSMPVALCRRLNEGCVPGIARVRRPVCGVQ